MINLAQRHFSSHPAALLRQPAAGKRIVARIKTCRRLVRSAPGRTLIGVGALSQAEPQGIDGDGLLAWFRDAGNSFALQLQPRNLTMAKF